MRSIVHRVAPRYDARMRWRAPRGIGAIVCGAAMTLALGWLGCAEVLGLEEWGEPDGGAGAQSSASGSTDVDDAGGTGGAGGATSQPAPACSDGVKGDDETDIDCGGGQCAPCDEGGACLIGSDCTSGVCSHYACTPNPCQPGAEPACNDCTMNGDESDVDCGSDCPPCGTTRACVSDADCVSGACGEEQECLPGPSGSACWDHGDCMTGTCEPGDCVTGRCCA